LFGYAKAQPEIMKSEALNNYRITIHSGTLIFLLRLGIINAGHFFPSVNNTSTSSVTALLLHSLLKKLDRLSDRVGSIHRLVDSPIHHFFCNTIFFEKKIVLQKKSYLCPVLVMKQRSLLC
jgi:predicted membrane chloride channel (bestrophin family)